jgi:hypothetical protein
MAILVVSVAAMALAAGGAEAKKRSGFGGFHAPRAHGLGFVRRSHRMTTRITNGRPVLRQISRSQA